MIGDLTFTQLYLMIAPKEQLTRRLMITPEAARRSGIIHRSKLAEGGSVAAQIRARKAAEREAGMKRARDDKRNRRERRRSGGRRR